jgi:hypothetical protein
MLIFQICFTAKAQPEGPFLATGFSVSTLLNNTYSWESEFALKKFYSINVSIGTTVKNKLVPTSDYRRSSFNEVIVNGNFFRLGQRVFIPLLVNMRVFMDVNYVYSVFSQDVTYEMSDFYGTYTDHFQYVGKVNGVNGGGGISRMVTKKIFVDASYYFCTYIANKPGYVGDYIPGLGEGRKITDKQGISSYLLVSAKYKLN